jgi:transcription elongation factor GreA
MNNIPKTILTPAGKQKLQEELALLRQTRPQIVAEVQTARALGDLKENSAYQANKDKMRQTDRRITQIELILRHCQVIAKDDTNAHQVQLGSKIVVKVKNKPNQEFTIVGQTEADPKEKKISLNSPLGRAFLDKKLNEEVEVITPNGKTIYKILKIS